MDSVNKGIERSVHLCRARVAHSSLQLNITVNINCGWSRHSEQAGRTTFWVWESLLEPALKCTHITSPCAGSSRKRKSSTCLFWWCDLQHSDYQNKSTKTQIFTLFFSFISKSLVNDLHSTRTRTMQHPELRGPLEFSFCHMNWEGVNMTKQGRSSVSHIVEEHWNNTYSYHLRSF